MNDGLQPLFKHERKLVYIINYKLMKKIYLLIIAMSLTYLSFPQQVPPELAESKKSNISKLLFLEGQWEGSGWMQMGAQRIEFEQKEDVGTKLDGTIMLIEGKGFEDGQLAFNAFGVVTWDNEAGVFNLYSNLSDGRSTMAQGEVPAENTFKWRYDVPMGKIRYTIVLNEKGEWFEIGEFSRDEETWFKFFEMTLRKL